MLDGIREEVVLTIGSDWTCLTGGHVQGVENVVDVPNAPRQPLVGGVDGDVTHVLERPLDVHLNREWGGVSRGGVIIGGVIREGVLSEEVISGCVGEDGDITHVLKRPLDVHLNREREGGVSRGGCYHRGCYKRGCIREGVLSEEVISGCVGVDGDITHVFKRTLDVHLNREWGGG